MYMYVPGAPKSSHLKNFAIFLRTIERHEIQLNILVTYSFTRKSGSSLNYLQNLQNNAAFSHVNLAVVTLSKSKLETFGLPKKVSK